jgi:DNA-binding IclR family transcriptional regulator
MNLSRALLLLRTLALSETAGLRGGELGERAGLHRVTVHRLLRELEREGLIEQDGNRRYHLGAMTWRLGLAAGKRFDLSTVAAPSLVRIESQIHDTVYLLRRVDDDALCIARRDGSYPIKSLVLEIGTSYPLGVGAGGLAVLAALPDVQVEEILERTVARLDPYPRVSESTIRRLLAETRAQGYASWPALISEAHVVGVPIVDAAGQPIGALSCAAIRERMQPQRRRQIASLLRVEAQSIHQRLTGAGASS